MLTSKIRAAAAALLAAASFAAASTVATAPADAAIKASSTGSSSLDDYCQKVAGLINEAIQQGNAASAAGDSDSAAQWYGLAEYMARDSIGKGCHFTQARHVITQRRLVTQLNLGAR